MNFLSGVCTHAQQPLSQDRASITTFPVTSFVSSTVRTILSISVKTVCHSKAPGTLLGIGAVALGYWSFTYAKNGDTSEAAVTRNMALLVGLLAANELYNSTS
jgi:hypothetical protein